ncbi:hypothetical protein [Allosphingosinicella vermicomposti]|uniref:hypothetical protein n=1 Tax=Allosphingosinicella vermicomposti TaxID=614671 RepID=UPI00131A5F7F|nr:hypothetical protein [Allosphingosinicella vermicomposti]
MTKPPKSTPHSDLDGIHEDERRNIDAANEAGQGSDDLARARKESVARPVPSNERDG